jgi:hypothetical protein
MSYGYPPPPPGGFAPQQNQIQPQQQAGGTGWVDNRTVIGGWFASQYNMQTGKYIEYKVMSQPTAKGGIFKSVKFFKPYQKKNGTMGESDNFSFNQMKELVEKINHFVNTYSDEKGYFIWQPAGMTQGVGQPPAPQQYPPQSGYPPAPQGYPPQPQYPAQGQPAPMPPQQQFAPQQQSFAAPGYPPQQPQQAPVQQPGAPGGPGGVVWP